MAMAKVFIPTTATTPISSSVAEATILEEDQLSPYPKAPPPSPELQSHVFDFNSLLKSLSPSNFEGLSSNNFERLSSSKFAEGPRELDFTTIFNSSHNGDKSPVTCISEPGSPPSSLGILPGRSPETSPTYHTPSPEEAEAGIPIPFHSHSPERSKSYPHSPTVPMPRPHVHHHHHHSSPQQVSSLPNGCSSNRHGDPPHPLLDSDVNPEESLPFHSRSHEMHTLHPHLPRSFDTARVSGGQPRVYGTSVQDEPTQRRRKISLKRKNDELGFDSNLDFSFEYSYSSSSGDSDWVVLDQSSCPLGKKVCHQDPHNSLSRQRSSSYGAGALTRPAPLHSQSQSQSIANLANFHQPPSSNTASNLPRSSSAAVPSMAVAIAPPFPSISSTDSLQLMDTGDSGLRLDSLDSMDTGDPTNIEMESLTNSMLSSTLLEAGIHGNGENLHPPPPPPHTQVSPVAAITIQSSTPPGRSHSSDASYPRPGSGPGLSPNTDSRHSFVQQFFSSYHQQYGFSGFSELGSNPSRFNFSKSL